MKAKKPDAGNNPQAEALAAFAHRWGFANGSPRLRVALTHKSVGASPATNNERLEFLGDALLGFVVAEFLVGALPRATEGLLSRARAQIVRRETLAGVARALGIEALLRVSAGEEKLGGRTRDSLLADAYEAIVGARFLEGGLEAAQQFVSESLGEVMKAVAQAPPDPDAKTRLQIVLQADGRGLPTYRIVSSAGQGHDMHFVAEALVGDEPLGRGEGTTKRIATTQAAQEALHMLEQKGF